MSEIATICPDRWKLAGQKADSFKVLEDKDKHVRYFVRFVRQLFTFRTSFQGTRLQSANRVRSPIIKTTLSGTHTCPYPTNIHQIDKNRHPWFAELVRRAMAGTQSLGFEPLSTIILTKSVFLLLRGKFTNRLVADLVILKVNKYPTRFYYNKKSIFSRDSGIALLGKPHPYFALEAWHLY